MYPTFICLKLLIRWLIVHIVIKNKRGGQGLINFLCLNQPWKDAPVLELIQLKQIQI